MAIFTHTDRDGDEMEILQAMYSGPALLVHTATGDRAISVRIPRSDVLRLANALDLWLNSEGVRVSAPAEDQEPIYTALVRRLVAEEVARVLPLHQAPQAAVPEPDAEAGWEEAPDFCTIVGCERFPKLGDHLEHGPEPKEVVPVHCVWPNCGHPRDMHGRGSSTGCNCGVCPGFTTDPEPKEVGHPERPSAADWSDRLWNGGASCDAVLKPGQILAAVHPECGNLWAVHKVAPKPRLMSELPKRPRVAGSVYCPDCRHLWCDHSQDTDGCSSEMGGRTAGERTVCECRRVHPEYTPSAP